jgi:hypothetical protein
MGWGLAANWVIVAGSVLLTIGTGAQAWASLSEYGDLFGETPDHAVSAFISISGLTSLSTSTADYPGPPIVGRILDLLGITPEVLQMFQPFVSAVSAIFVIPRKLAAIRAAGGEDAARLAQLLRQAGVWTLLMAGSMLVLAGAAIQLALIYTG